MKRDDRLARQFRRHPLAVAALLALGGVEAGWALPQGERVVAGDVGFARPGPGSLTIQQRTAKGIVSWGGFSIDRRQVELDKPIKETGSFTIPIRLHREVTAKVNLKVAVPATAKPEMPAEPTAQEEPGRKSSRKKKSAKTTQAD